jgi:hypothetical protein
LRFGVARYFAAGNSLLRARRGDCTGVRRQSGARIAAITGKEAPPTMSDLPVATSRRRPPWWGVAWIVLGVAWLIFESVRHKPVGIVVAAGFLVLAAHFSTRPPKVKTLRPGPAGPAALPTGVRMPEIVVKPPVSRWITVARLIALPVVIVIGYLVVGILARDPGQVSSALVGLLYVGAVIGCSLYFGGRFQTWDRARMLAKAPPGSLFAGPAAQLPTRTVADLAPTRYASMRGGRFVLGADGVGYAPSSPTASQSPIDIAWSQISRLTLTPLNGFRSKIEVVVGGSIMGWRVSGASELADAVELLRRLSGQSS